MRAARSAIDALSLVLKDREHANAPNLIDKTDKRQDRLGRTLASFRAGWRGISPRLCQSALAALAGFDLLFEGGGGNAIARVHSHASPASTARPTRNWTKDERLSVSRS